MAKKNTYAYKEKDFHSLKELSKYVKINEKTLAARIRRGMSIDEACAAKDFRCHYFNIDGEEKSITQVCEDQAKDAALVSNRMKYGYSMHEALNKPKKVTKQGKPIVVNGILYNSVAEAIRKLELPEKESTIRRRLASGEIPDNAFSFDD